MRLRELQMRDAEDMLEWMHDEEVVHHLSANFASKTIDDCKKFIECSQKSEKDIHYAIVDDNDEYEGTVSLKHIDRYNKTAEFAITVCKRAMGKGYSTFGMAEILRIGIEDLGLDTIYWCVSKANERAVRFYDKNKYSRTINVPEHIRNCYTKEQNDVFIWYVYSKQECLGE